MKIIDFDRKFFEYARKWVAAHPDLTPEQVEDSYNEIMQAWIATPADWLDGACPGTYFEQERDPAALIALMEGYAKAKIKLPEPLYARIVELGLACAPMLREILSDDAREEGLRAQALGLLRDVDDPESIPILEMLVCGAQAQSELIDLAADILSKGSADAAQRLLEAYPGAPEYAQDLILDIASNFPGDERIYDFLIWRLKNRPERRALWATLLGKLGDARAIGPLEEALGLSDLKYLDYLALRDAVEALGGEVEQERDFYGDPDFEALRGM